MKIKFKVQDKKAATGNDKLIFLLLAIFVIALVIWGVIKLDLIGKLNLYLPGFGDANKNPVETPTPSGADFRLWGRIDAGNKIYYNPTNPIYSGLIVKSSGSKNYILIESTKAVIGEYGSDNKITLYEKFKSQCAYGRFSENSATFQGGDAAAISKIYQLDGGIMHKGDNYVFIYAPYSTFSVPIKTQLTPDELKKVNDKLVAQGSAPLSSEVITFPSGNSNTLILSSKEDGDFSLFFDLKEGIIHVEPSKTLSSEKYATWLDLITEPSNILPPSTNGIFDPVALTKNILFIVNDKKLASLKLNGKLYSPVTEPEINCLLYGTDYEPYQLKDLSFYLK